MNIRAAEILSQSMKFRRPRNRRHPRFLRQNPSERNLRRRRFFLFREFRNQINDSLIRFAVLSGESRHDVSEIAFVELRVLTDRSSQKYLPERAERHKADSQFL